MGEVGFMEDIWSKEQRAQVEQFGRTFDLNGRIVAEFRKKKDRVASDSWMEQPTKPCQK